MPRTVTWCTVFMEVSTGGTDMAEHRHVTTARRRERGRGLLTAVTAGLTAALVALGSGLLFAVPAQAASVPDSFTLHGSGYGHGVGMPQYGAYEMSRSGAAHSGRAILRYYHPGTTVEHRQTRRQLAVQVYGPSPYGTSSRADRGSTTTVTVHGGSWRVRDMKFRTVLSGRGTTKITVKALSGGKVRVAADGKHHDGARLRIHWSGTRYFKPGGTRAVATVAGAHGSYRHGRLTTRALKGVPNITNDVLLNTEYLYGIAEMPSSWGLHGGKHALSAQAIAARSYAMTKSWKSGCACHVVDDVRDQQYTGWKKENEGTGGRYGKVWKSAVNATRSGDKRARVLLYGGKPVAAYYFSSSGGRTADSEDVWSSYLPYERSVADPYSKRAPGNSYASWTRKLTQKKAAALFGLNNVASIKVTARWTSGQVRTLKATQPNGKTSTISGKADQIRSRLGAKTKAGSMPASWVTRISKNW